LTARSSNTRIPVQISREACMGRTPKVVLQGDCCVFIVSDLIQKWIRQVKRLVSKSVIWMVNNSLSEAKNFWRPISEWHYQGTGFCKIVVWRFNREVTAKS
jgi:hypothetical protein